MSDASARGTSRVRAVAIGANVAVILALLWTLRLNLEFHPLVGPDAGAVVDVGTPLIIGDLVLLIPALGIGLWAFAKRGFSGPLLLFDVGLAIECVAGLSVLAVVYANGHDVTSEGLWTATLLVGAVTATVAVRLVRKRMPATVPSRDWAAMIGKAVVVAIVSFMVLYVVTRFAFTALAQ